MSCIAMRTKLYNCSVRYSHIRKTVSHTYTSRKQTHFTWPEWFRYEWYGVVDSQWNFFSLFIFIYPFSRFFFSSNLVKCWYFNETSWSASECNDTNTILSNTYWIGVHISGEKNEMKSMRRRHMRSIVPIQWNVIVDGSFWSGSVRLRCFGFI